MERYHELRQAAQARAQGRCEYCLMYEDVDPAPYHLEHIIARQHQGRTDLTNLAWACSHCNLHKGTNIAGFDYVTMRIVPLFNPRTDRWKDHFKLEGARIIGSTPSGRASAELLRFNDPKLIELRESLIAEKLFPGAE